MSTSLKAAQRIETIDPVDGLPVLPVGTWALDKHALLRKYVELTWGPRKNWAHRGYLDLYCGPGRVQVRGSAEIRDGGALQAWRASTERDGTFTEVCIGDLDTCALNACGTRLRKYGAPISCFEGTASETVDSMLQTLPRNGLNLAYLDPFNLEHLPFRILERLSTLDPALI
jgi:three-Cys-motif partner protein